MVVFGICKFFGRYFGNMNKKWTVYGIWQIQFLIENNTMTVFVQKLDYSITVIYKNINGKTVL